MTVLGIAYIVHRRRRVHARAAAGEPTSNYPAHALLGGVLSTITSFIPLSPIIEGGLTGYIERGDSTRTVSVDVASAVVLSALHSLWPVRHYWRSPRVFSDRCGGFAPMTAITVIVTGLVSLGVTVLLGAGGEWIGGKLAERGS